MRSDKEKEGQTDRKIEMQTDRQIDSTMKDKYRERHMRDR